MVGWGGAAGQREPPSEKLRILAVGFEDCVGKSNTLVEQRKSSFRGGACIMYGLKRLNGGAASSLPAVDAAAAAAACPASLEISGHR